MNGQDPTSFDPRIADWLEDDPNTAPAPALQIVLAAFPSIRQRHAMRLPRRFPSMLTPPKLALGAAAVIAVVLGGFMILRPPSSVPVVGPPGPTSSPSPSGSAAIDTSAWKTFTSARYGFSYAYPPDFAAAPSSTFWVIPETSATSMAEWDAVIGQGSGPTWWGSSVARPPGQNFETWVAAYQRGQVNPSEPDACDPTKAQLEPIVIDGRPARLRIGCGEMEALLDVDGRVYSFSGGNMAGTGSLVSPALETRFRVWLTTIHLDPASAVQPPAAAPTVPIDWTTYTSSRFAYSIDHPASWSLTPAASDWPKIGLPEKGGQTMDVFGQTPSGISVWVTSVPVTSANDTAALLAAFDSQNTAFCNSTSNRHDITLDGVAMRQEDQVCAQSVQVVEVLGASKDRFFEINLVSSSERGLSDTNRATFDRFLSSFRFDS
jgi:hypothetical protein